MGRIAVLVGGSLGYWFNGSILDAIYATLHDSDSELLIFRIHSQAEREEFFTTLPARRHADAIIVASFALAAAERSRLRHLSMLVVFLNQRVRAEHSGPAGDAPRHPSRHGGADPGRRCSAASKTVVVPTQLILRRTTGRVDPPGQKEGR